MVNRRETANLIQSRQAMLIKNGNEGINLRSDRPRQFLLADHLDKADLGI